MKGRHGNGNGNGRARARGWRRAALALLLGLAGVSGINAAAPRWLMEDAALADGPGMPLAGAEILRMETIIEVEDSGAWRQTRRQSVRIRHVNGASWASCGLHYVDHADTVQKTDAWLVRGGHDLPAATRDIWSDHAAVDDATMYSDFRLRIGTCRIAAVGDVFGSETIVRRQSQAGQDQIVFSSPLPARWQRLEVRVPAGWRVRWAWLNGSGPEATVNARGTTWVWELKDLPAERVEPWAPEQPLVRGALSFEPPGQSLAMVPDFSTWEKVSSWLNALQDGACDRDAGLVATVRRLVAGAAGPKERLEVLTRYVQERRYVQVNRNNGQGFGYRPRPATEVLAADYGDCKDKSNLLRALLREVGIEAWLVVAYLGDPDALRPAWPSPTQFNHAILAIRLPDGVDFPGASEDTPRGRVVYFDATSRWTPLGRLPWLLQGSWVLPCDGTSGLRQLPRDGAIASFRSTLRARLNLDDRLGFRGDLVEQRSGELAVPLLDAEFRQSREERRNLWSQRLAATIQGVELDDMTTTYSRADWTYETNLAFHASRFGQLVRHEMIVLPMGALVRENLPALAEGERQHDLLVPPLQASGELSINVPAGMSAELPPALTVQAEFGEYHARFAFEDGRIVYRRTLAFTGGRVAPSNYSGFRRFVLQVAKAERSTALLRWSPEPATK